MTQSQMANDLISHAYAMKSPHKNPKGEGSESLQAGGPEHFNVLDPKLHKDTSSFVWDLTLCISSAGC